MQAFLTDPVMTTTLVMNRIQKLYAATEQLAVCFKLIYKLRSQPENEQVKLRL